MHTVGQKIKNNLGGHGIITKVVDKMYEVDWDGERGHFQPQSSQVRQMTDNCDGNVDPSKTTNRCTSSKYRGKGPYDEDFSSDDVSEDGQHAADI